MSSLVQSVDWLAIAPPTIAAVVGLVVLVADLFVGEHRKPLLGWLSVAGLAAAALMLLPLLDADRSTFCLVGDTGVCSYTADRFTLVIQFLVLGGALLAALLCRSPPSRTRTSGSPRGSTGSCSCPPRPAPPSCPPPATSRP
ncbi:NADH:ubiquinone oxidoreductase subunit 2 (subunit N) [Streptomyces calvus]